MNSARAADIHSPSYRDVRRRLRTPTGVALQLGAFAFLIGVAAAGYLLAPSTSPPIDVGTHARWGGWALEAAFTYSAFHAAVISFRAAELLFRDPLSELVRTFPVPTGDVVRERIIAVMLDSARFFAPALAFFAGVLLAAPTFPIALSVAYVVAAIIINGGLAFGVTVVLVSSSDRFGQWFAMSNAQGAASKAAFFATAPAVTLAVVGVTDLFMKLGWEELFATIYRDPTFSLSRAAVVVFFAIGALFLSSIIGGIRQARGGYRRFLAEFDRSMFQPPGEQEWVSNESVPRSRWTRGLSAHAGLLADRKRTEFRRVHPFLLVGNILTAFLFLVAAIAWRENAAMRFLPAAMAALWVAGAVRIPERLNLLSSASETLDRTLVPLDVNDATTAYAGWILGTHVLAPLAVAGVVSTALFSGVSGIAIACLATLLVEQWVAFRSRLRGGELAARSVAILVGIGVSFAAITTQAMSPWLDFGIGTTVLAGWLWLGMLLRQACDGIPQHSSPTAHQT